MQCLSLCGAPIRLFILLLQPHCFTASDVPGRSHSSVATVSTETRLPMAEPSDDMSASSPGSQSVGYRGVSITFFFFSDTKKRLKFAHVAKSQQVYKVARFLCFTNLYSV